MVNKLLLITRISIKFKEEIYKKFLFIGIRMESRVWRGKMDEMNVIVKFSGF